MWVVGSIAAVVGLVAVVVAFLFEPASDARDEVTSTLGPGLPRPEQIRRLRFPSTAWGGYDQRVVDAELAELAARYEALYLAAGPSTIAEAERRLADGAAGSRRAPSTADAPGAAAGADDLS